MNANGSLPTAFRDIPADAFPFVIEFFRAIDWAGTEPIHRIEVDGPGAVYVPPLAEKAGMSMWVRVTYANGQVVEQPVDG